MAKNVFDIYAQKYDDWFTKHQHAYLTELLTLKKEIPNSKKGIDIGIGTARFAQVLNIPFGIDISCPMLRIAETRGCYVAAADAEDLPFESNKFDYALLMVTLCFVKSPKRVIQEAQRILKKKGKLIIGMIDEKSHLGRMYRKKNGIFYRSARFYSTEDVRKLLKSNNFAGIKIWQALFNNSEHMDEIADITEGYGKGGFIVMSGTKK